MKENKRGITLIALVVTIVVLLILAGISISLLTGENGVITQAKKSKEKTIVGDEKEGISLAYSSCKSDNMMENVTANQLEERMKSDGKDVTVTQDGLDLKVRYPKTGHEYTVNQNGKVDDDFFSDSNQIVDGIYMYRGAFLEKKSGEVIYVEFDGNKTGEVNIENGIVVSKNAISQKSEGFFLDKKGKVYGIDNTKGTPICINDLDGSELNGKVVKKIYYNRTIFAAIDIEGKVYTCGSNYFGQLGNGTTDDINYPICISDVQGSDLNNKEITEIRCNGKSSVAIDTNGKVYTWGVGYGLGNGTEDNSSIPKCINNIEGSSINGKSIIQIEQNEGYSVALDNEGDVHTWGIGGWSKMLIPSKIISEKKITYINMSKYNSSFFALGENKESYIYKWNSNDNGEIKLLNAPNGEKIVSADYESAIDEKGQYYEFDDNYNLKYLEINGNEIVSILKNVNGSGQTFALDSNGIGYLKGREFGTTYQPLNNEKEYRIIKVNSIKDEEGLLYITDKGKVFYISFENGLL